MRFAIIIPVHNALDDLLRCLKSIEEKTITPCQLILVNDASNRDTTDYLLKYCRDNGAFYVKNGRPKPEGFSKTANAGIREASKDIEYFCILNSDTIIGTPCWNDKIMEVGDMFPDVGLLSVLSNSATSQTIDFPLDTDIETMTQIIEWASECHYPEVYLPNGFCYIIKRPVIQKIGMFDVNAFPHYGSEDDYSLIARQHRFMARICDNVFVWHKGQASYGTETKNIVVQQTVQRLLNKHGKEKTRDLMRNNDLGLRYIKEKVRNYYE